MGLEENQTAEKQDRLAPQARAWLDHMEGMAGTDEPPPVPGEAEAAPAAPPEPPAPAEAPEAPPAEKPAESASERLTKHLEKGGEEPPASGWDDTARNALKRAKLKDGEIEELEQLIEEKPWLRGWVDGLQKAQSDTDDVIADLRAKAQGSREPTPTAEKPTAEQDPLSAGGDQPGSGEVADLLQRVTEELGGELGDDNAGLLRDLVKAVRSETQSEISALRSQLDGHTRAVESERGAAEFGQLVERARHDLRDEFPWISDDSGFERVVDEMTKRPTHATPEAVKEGMRAAAKVAFFDELREDARGAAARLDNHRKERLAATAPNTAPIEPDRPRSEREISLGIMEMMDSGAPAEQIEAWALRQRRRLQQ